MTISYTVYNQFSMGEIILQLGAEKEKSNYCNFKALSDSY